MSEFGQLSESMRACYFRWTSLGVIIDPTPAPTAVIVALDGTQSALTLTKQGTGTATRFYPDVSQASAGLYEILATTTDATVDAATFAEYIRIGQPWIESMVALLARLGAFTGTGVNTVLGFLKALGSKIAATPSDMGGTYDASTDSTEAILDSLAETSELVDATWDELIAAHLAAGTTGAKLNSASTGGDPWATDLPGAYAGLDAGNLLNQIYQRSLLISAGRTTVVSSYNARTRKLTLYKNDTPLMPFTGLDPGLTGATAVKLAIRAAGTTGAALKTLSGVVVSDTSLAVQITAAFFTDLEAGDCVYEYDVQATLLSGEIRSPIWRSELEIVDDIAA